MLKRLRSLCSLSFALAVRRYSSERSVRISVAFFVLLASLTFSASVCEAGPGFESLPPTGGVQSSRDLLSGVEQQVITRIEGVRREFSSQLSSLPMEMKMPLDLDFMHSLSSDGLRELILSDKAEIPEHFVGTLVGAWCEGYDELISIAMQNSESDDVQAVLDWLGRLDCEKIGRLAAVETVRINRMLLQELVSAMN